MHLLFTDLMEQCFENNAADPKKFIVAYLSKSFDESLSDRIEIIAEVKESLEVAKKYPELLESVLQRLQRIESKQFCRICKRVDAEEILDLSHQQAINHVTDLKQKRENSFDLPIYALANVEPGLEPFYREIADVNDVNDATPLEAYSYGPKKSPVVLKRKRVQKRVEDSSSSPQLSDHGEQKSYNSEFFEFLNSTNAVATPIMDYSNKAKQSPLVRKRRIIRKFRPNKSLYVPPYNLSEDKKPFKMLLRNRIVRRTSQQHRERIDYAESPLYSSFSSDYESPLRVKNLNQSEMKVYIPSSSSSLKSSSDCEKQKTKKSLTPNEKFYDSLTDEESEVSDSPSISEVSCSTCLSD